jgi:hypothetical protein
VKVNPKNFDWFMAGLDQERIKGILEAVSKENPELEQTIDNIRAGDLDHYSENDFQNHNLVLDNGSELRHS